MHCADLLSLPDLEISDKSPAAMMNDLVDESWPNKEKYLKTYSAFKAKIEKITSQEQDFSAANAPKDYLFKVGLSFLAPQNFAKLNGGLFSKSSLTWLPKEKYEEIQQIAKLAKTNPAILSNPAYTQYVRYCGFVATKLLDRRFNNIEASGSVYTEANHRLIEMPANFNMFPRALLKAFDEKMCEVVDEMQGKIVDRAKNKLDPKIVARATASSLKGLDKGRDEF